MFDFIKREGRCLPSFYLVLNKWKYSLFSAIILSIIYLLFVTNNVALNECLCIALMDSSVWVLNIFADSGSNTYIISMLPDFSSLGHYQRGVIMNLDNTSGLQVGRTCLGLPMLYFGMSFFLVFPGKSLLNKILFAIICIVLLYLTNVFRVSLLIYFYRIDVNLFYWFHSFLLKYTYYLVFFALAFYYVENNSK